jgi:hypothetical protein
MGAAERALLAAGQPVIEDLDGAMIRIWSFPSCQQIHSAGFPIDTSGVRLLHAPGEPALTRFTFHWCEVDGDSSDVVWTLVLKGSGSDSQMGFREDAAWRDGISLTGLADLTTITNFGLFAAWYAAPVTEVLLRFADGGQLTPRPAGLRLVLPQPVTMAASVGSGMTTEVNASTASAAANLALGETTYVHTECVRAGVNLQLDKRRVRVGVIAVDQADCSGNDIVVGMGIAELASTGGPDGTLAGGHREGGGNGNELPQFTFVLVR